MIESVILKPIFDWPVIWVLLAVVTATLILLVVRGGAGRWLRVLALLGLVSVFLQPHIQQKDVQSLDDIILVIEDATRSQNLGGRAEQTRTALEVLKARFSDQEKIIFDHVVLRDSPENAGTLLSPVLQETLNAHPNGQIAGIFVVSDGVVHELDAIGDIPAPLHVLLTGRRSDFDRRLRVLNAPSFGILGETVRVRLKVEDRGSIPQQAKLVPISISVDGKEPLSFNVETEREVELEFSLPHGGRNIVTIKTDDVDGELTFANNSTVLAINGIRDRLRVLLVSGMPNAGTRTWRNLLKSDSSVDLVHFTILRPPEKQDGVPVNELSLIAFPTRELFLDKIDEFDLIIFDRFKRRGILPPAYLENIVSYVQEGGALLVAAGPDFAGASSISRSPLQDVLPAQPNGRVISQKIQPALSDVGKRHPVTQGLGDPAKWGPWMRQIGVIPTRGHAVMSGSEDAPLLILDRVESGRVALLLSDQTWLWGRNFEGGGPQSELLRRLAHWLMKEPELEEETLEAEQTPDGVIIKRRTLDEAVPPAVVTAPSGASYDIEFAKVAEGEFAARFENEELGIFRLKDDTLETVFALGALSSKELEAPLTDEMSLASLVEMSGGGQFWLEDGFPTIRTVAEGRVTSGKGWMGITPRNSEAVLSMSSKPILPDWIWAILVVGLAIGAWLFEGRKR